MVCVLRVRSRWHVLLLTHVCPDTSIPCVRLAPLQLNSKWRFESSLFSQYAFTVAGVTSGTGYALYKKPKNGVGAMVVAGVAGSLADLAYGWTIACRPYVEAWQQHELELQRQKEEESERNRSNDKR